MSTYEHVLRGVALVALAVGMAACIAFCPLYHTLTGGAWRRTVAGWHLMISTADFGLILALAFSARVFGRWPGLAEALTFAYLLFGVAMVWRVIILVRAQIARRKEASQ